MAVEEQGFQDGDGVEMLTVGGVEDGEIDGESVSALFGTVPEDDFAEDDRLPERLLGMIVGWRHAVDIEEREQAVVIALGIEEAQSKTLGIRVREGFGAEDVQLVVEFWDARLGGAEGDQPCVALTTKITSAGDGRLGLKREACSVFSRARKSVFSFSARSKSA